MTETSVKVGDEATLTIDELAQRVGMTVRNLREWRALGLLPAPEMRGRVGYYGAGTVARIERIRQLHAEGFTLELIRRLLDASGDASDEVLGFARALREPFRDEHPPPADPAELAANWGITDPAMLERALELGLLRRREDGGLEFTSARVARVGEKLHELGLTAEQSLDATAEIRTSADRVAELFHRTWLDHVWQPFLDAGQPPERWAEIRRHMEELQPLAIDAVIGIFQVAMEAKIEEGIALEVERAERD